MPALEEAVVAGGGNPVGPGSWQASRLCLEKRRRTALQNFVVENSILPQIFNSKPLTTFITIKLNSNASE